MTSRRLLDPISKILLDAADYIEKHGHCKGQLEAFDGSVCVRGAMMRACGIFTRFIKNKDMDMADDRVRELVRSTFGDKYGSSFSMMDHVNWNNAPERTQEEVVSLLREAALMEAASTKTSEMEKV